jgi:transcriptional regulator with XRE-family HTH domain
VQLRGEVGLTQEQLAWAADLGSKGYLSRIESGQRLPSLELVERLAKELAVEPRDLLTFPEVGPSHAAAEQLRIRSKIVGRTGAATGMLRAAEPKRPRRR